MRRAPDAILLCGGAGLRLRSVIGNAPKGMARVAGRPFLELLLYQLLRHGFERVILAVGYQNEMIHSHFGVRTFGLDLVYSIEASPLGTGGALRNAADLVESESVLIMNGDSHTDADLNKLVASHHEAKADASVVVVPADGRADCGSVRVDECGRLARFDEKQGSAEASYVNAGIYLLSRNMLYGIPSGISVSLEQELFPRWLAERKDIRAFVHQGKCVDIGTPERYHGAQTLLADVETDVNAAVEVHER
jgi:D-glycero-alpha-D-manno-heptose 1-phosphate guanylyltransferase